MYNKRAPALIDIMVEWKRTYGPDYPNFTLNILRFPSFQSAVVLPKRIKDDVAQQLTLKLKLFKEDLHEMEANQIARLIEYLKTVNTPHTGADTLDKLQRDFKNFYTQYDTRRGKSFEKTFSNELVTWYEQI